MHIRSLSLAILPIALATAVAAQPNIRPGTNVSLSDLGGIASPGGARIGTFPSGQQSWGVTTTACNVGTVNVPWLADMNVDHPEIGMVMYREFQGRFEQISVFKGLKHGFTSTNSPGCGNCPGGAGSSLVINCTDTYGAGLNYDHFWMAPPSEINPWTGTWTSRGSHFDRGFPPVSGAAATDNVRSTINFPASNQGYRNLVNDAGLNSAGATFWIAGFYNVNGEPEANRENNWRTRQFNATWGGSAWQFSNPNNTQFNTPAIYRWTGATVSSATNGPDDGRFYVAVKVTGPTNGLYRYDYAVFNRDNNRQGDVIRIPICAGASVSNLTVRDPDLDSANDWTIARVGNELVATAPAGDTNNITWGNLFNISFDSDASPATANVTIEQAIAGAGAPSVAVAARAPLDVRNLNLGGGCGTPGSPVLAANGPARLGTPTFALNIGSVANGSSNAFLLSPNQVSLPVGPCTITVDPNALVILGVVSANPSGVASFTLPIPNNANLDGAAMIAQGFEVQASGSLLGVGDLSNGLKIKLGVLNAGCN